MRVDFSRGRLICWLLRSHVFEFIVNEDDEIMSPPFCVRCGKGPTYMGTRPVE